MIDESIIEKIFNKWLDNFNNLDFDFADKEEIAKEAFLDAINLLLPIIETQFDALNFYAHNFTTVFDINGEFLLEDESELARKTKLEVEKMIKEMGGLSE